MREKAFKHSKILLALGKVEALLAKTKTAAEAMTFLS